MRVFVYPASAEGRPSLYIKERVKLVSFIDPAATRWVPLLPGHLYVNPANVVAVLVEEDEPEARGAATG